MPGDASHSQQVQLMQKAFRSLLHTYDMCMQRTLRKYGLYPGQPELLLCIRALSAPTQNQIAAMMSLSRASVGVSLKRLAQAGFVKRTRDKKDTRCIRIALTPKGEEYAHWCELDLEMIHATMMESLSGEQRAETPVLFDKICASLQSYNERLENKV